MIKTSVIKRAATSKLPVIVGYMRLCVKYVHTSRVFNLTYNSGDRNVAHIFKGEKIYERHGTKAI